MSTAAATAVATADPQARSAITREAGLPHARGVRAVIVLGRDLDVLVLLAAVSVAVFNPQIGKVDLLIEVGQVVLPRPLADLFIGPIGMAIVVCAVAISLVQPTLVLTLELVVEHHPFDMRAALCQAACNAFVRAIDLEVVFELALAFYARPERLAVTLVAVATVFEQASAIARERHRMLARAGHPNRLDQSLFAQVSQVARPGIQRPVVVISEITTGDNSERTDGGERARLRAA